jgi:hypothetical protein
MYTRGISSQKVFWPSFAAILRLIFPTGTIVVPNIWAVAHDESTYEDPFAFKPECFLTYKDKLNDGTQVLAYGFGRRFVVLISLCHWFSNHLALPGSA